MARPLRIEYEGACYHVTARGNDRKKIFFSPRDYERFREYLVMAGERFGCLLHAYVLMGNHYHLLLETPLGNLSRVMHYIKGSYTTYVNTKRKRSGHLFQGRYKSIVVDTDSYLLELSRYIHLNPVRAGIQGRPEDYQYSSYRNYLQQEEDDLVSRKLTFQLLSCNQESAANLYREFVESSLGKALQNPLENTYGGVVLRFVRQLLDRLEGQVGEKEELSHRKALTAPTTVGEVLTVITSTFNIGKEDLGDSLHRKARDFAIYLLKRQTAASNKEIGTELGRMSSAAVAKAWQRIRAKLNKNAELAAEVKVIKRELSRVRG